MGVDIHFTVTARPDLERDGEGDSVIAAWPKQAGQVLSVGYLRAFGVTLGDRMAGLVDCVFRDGEFWVTNDPETVAAKGSMPMHEGCADCEDGIKTALAALEADPEQRLVVGWLWWAKT